ncbi:hypothetical protein E2C01_040738 [Portunus trituberculatus]|uniref:Uncharacterized protein n=1 Tax=Portunus trituberculatus TaxID=210409 RepID=A0A5B7FRJ9_PORTR|nr:hypothetical protein [Portunus trituberculatus]
MGSDLSRGHGGQVERKRKKGCGRPTYLPLPTVTYAKEKRGAGRRRGEAEGVTAGRKLFDE